MLFTHETFVIAIAHVTGTFGVDEEFYRPICETRGCARRRSARHPRHTQRSARSGNGQTDGRRVCGRDRLAFLGRCRESPASRAFYVLIRRKGETNWTVAKTGNGKSLDVFIAMTTPGVPEILQVRIQVEKEQSQLRNADRHDLHHDKSIERLSFYLN